MKPSRRPNMKRAIQRRQTSANQGVVEPQTMTRSAVIELPEAYTPPTTDNREQSAAALSPVGVALEHLPTALMDKATKGSSTTTEGEVARVKRHTRPPIHYPAPPLFQINSSSESPARVNHITHTTNTYKEMSIKHTTMSSNTVDYDKSHEKIGASVEKKNDTYKHNIQAEKLKSNKGQKKYAVARVYK